MIMNETHQQSHHTQMPIYKKNMLNRVTILTGMVCLACLVLISPLEIPAMHVTGEEFKLRQPDGTLVSVRIWGDEFYQVVESLDGYTLIRDPKTNVICYAKLSEDGSEFLSTGIPVGSNSKSALALPKKLRLNAQARRARMESARARFAEGEAEVMGYYLTKGLTPPGTSTPKTSVSASSTRSKTAAVGADTAVTGDRRGLCLIVDFTDQRSTITPDEINNYCNQTGYNGFGNNGSVHDYFYDVSDGELNYTLFVPDSYYTLSHPKSYYDSPSQDNGLVGREVVLEALNHLESQGYDFSRLDGDGDGFIDTINLFYAGTADAGWGKGLWPHSWTIQFEADGVSAYKYQITNLGDQLALATFIHENGHALCNWPDLYDYDYDSSGVGRWCVMASSSGTRGARFNPVEPNGYFKNIAGWTMTRNLSSNQTGTVRAGINEIYQIQHPVNKEESFVIENRNRSGRDQELPGSGLAIWHVDETLGDRDSQQNTYAQHYVVSLIQADGNLDLENDVNGGDEGDLFSSPYYPNWSAQTLPNSNWWDGRDSGVSVSSISAPGNTMTFNFQQTTPEKIPDSLNINTEENFPDTTFRAIVEDFVGVVSGGAFTAERAALVSAAKEFISCRDKNIQDLKGIEFFTELRGLYCDRNNLTQLDLTANTKLEEVWCYRNQLSLLDVSGLNSLYELIAFTNQLTDLSGIVANTSLGSGDVVDVRWNRLTCDVWDQVQDLRARLGDATFSSSDWAQRGLAYVRQTNSRLEGCSSGTPTPTPTLEFANLVANGPAVTSEISTSNSDDWYQLQISTTGEYVIETSAVSGQQTVDTVLEIYGPDEIGAILFENDDINTSSNRYSRITANLEANRTYFVRVRGYSSSNVGWYSVQATSSQTQDTPTHTPSPTNTPPSAATDTPTTSPTPSYTPTHTATLHPTVTASHTPTPLSGEPSFELTVNGAVVMSVITEDNTEDWYRFQTGESGEYTIQTFAVSGQATIDTVMTLYGPASQEIQIAENDDIDINSNRYSRIVATLDANQTYFIKVRGYSTSTLGVYAIQVTSAAEQPTETPTEIATDTPTSIITPIVTSTPTPTPGIEVTELHINGDAISSYLSPENVEDWYYFWSGAGGVTTLETMPVDGQTNVDTFMEIYGPDPSTDLLAYNDDINYPSNRYSQIVITLEPERLYFVRVRGFTEYSEGFYAIQLTSDLEQPTVILTPTPTHTAIPTPTTVSESNIIAIEVNGPSLTGIVDKPEEGNVYYFQTAFTGRYTIETSQATGEETFDTVIGLFGPDSLDRLIALNDDIDFETNRFSRITNTLEAGHTYYVVVIGYGEATGSYELTVTGEEGVLTPTPTPLGSGQHVDSVWTDTTPNFNGILGINEWDHAAVFHFDGSDSSAPGIVGADSYSIGGVNGDGFQTADDSSVTVYVMNNDEYIYIAIDAVDDVLDFSNSSIWLADSCEIRIDGNFSRLSQIENNAFGFNAIILGDGSEREFFPTGADLASAAQIKSDRTGWTVEFRVARTGFAPVIGFDLSINDSDDPAESQRDSQYCWNAAFDASYYDETQWGTMSLAVSPDSTPTPTAAASPTPAVIGSRSELHVNNPAVTGEVPAVGETADYWFYAEIEGVYTITTSQPEGADSFDTILELTGPEDESLPISTNDDIDINSNRYSRIVQNLQGGAIYFVTVRGFSTSTGVFGIGVAGPQGTQATPTPVEEALQISSVWATSPPVLDGLISSGEWDNTTTLEFDGSDGIRPGIASPDSNIIGGPNGDGFQTAEDSRATVHIMNDGTYFYVAIDVDDDILDFSQATIWRNDAVEIRIDGNYSRLSQLENNIFGFNAIVRGDGGAVGNFTPGLGIDSAARAKSDSSGWIVEFRCTLADFSRTIGFDIAIDDSDDPNQTARDSHYRWHGRNDSSSRDEGQWGIVVLADNPAGEPTPTPTLPGAIPTPMVSEGCVLLSEFNDPEEAFLAVQAGDGSSVEKGATWPVQSQAFTDGTGLRIQAAEGDTVQVYLAKVMSLDEGILSVSYYTEDSDITISLAVLDQSVFEERQNLAYVLAQGSEVSVGTPATIETIYDAPTGGFHPLLQVVGPGTVYFDNLMLCSTDDLFSIEAALPSLGNQVSSPILGGDGSIINGDMRDGLQGFYQNLLGQPHNPAVVSSLNNFETSGLPGSIALPSTTEGERLSNITCGLDIDLPSIVLVDCYAKRVSGDEGFLALVVSAIGQDSNTDLSTFATFISAEDVMDSSRVGWTLVSTMGRISDGATGILLTVQSALGDIEFAVDDITIYELSGYGNTANLADLDTSLLGR